MHDVTHRAFSHVADVLYKESLKSIESSYHEINVAEFIHTKTDLPQVIPDERLLVYYINLSNHPLVEQPAPAMCADRIDYFLRDIIALKIDCLEVGLVNDISRRNWVDEFIHSLVCHNGMMMTRDEQKAIEASILFMCLNDLIYTSKESIGVYHLTSRLFTMAIERKLLSDDDFDQKGDEEIWKVVGSTSMQYEDMQQIWRVLNSAKTEYMLVESSSRENESNPPQGWQKIAGNLQLRMRYIDPHILSYSKQQYHVKQASDVNSRLKNVLIPYRNKGLKYWDVYYKSPSASS